VMKPVPTARLASLALLTRYHTRTATHTPLSPLTRPHSRPFQPPPPLRARTPSKGAKICSVSPGSTASPCPNTDRQPDVNPSFLQRRYGAHHPRLRPDHLHPRRPSCATPAGRQLRIRAATARWKAIVVLY
jgi:hypothetical protein